MKSVRATEPFIKGPGDERNWGFNFTEAITLPAGTTITSVEGTPDVTSDDEDPVTLTLSNQTPNAATYEEEIVQNGVVVGTRTVAIGKAIKADVAGGIKDANYLVSIVVNLSTGEKIQGVWPVWVRQ